MNSENKTVEELKQMCKKKNITGYSKLLKEDLIKVLSKKMKGGEFDETKLIGKYSKNFSISSNDKRNCVKSRKNFAASPVYFIALRDDNIELFKSLNTNQKLQNENPFTCSLPDNSKIEVAGEIFAQFNDFLIIRKRK